MAFTFVITSGTTFTNGVTQLNAANLNGAFTAATFATSTANSFVAFNGTAPVDGTFGTSLSWSAGVLNAIQDIRTTASPAFVGLGLTNFASITMSGPNFRLIGTEGSAKSISLLESAGSFFIGETGVANWAQFTTTGLNATDIGQTTPGKVGTAAAAAAAAGLNVPHGAAPTAPVNGDLWTTTAGMFVRINGVTKTVTLT